MCEGSRGKFALWIRRHEVGRPQRKDDSGNWTLNQFQPVTQGLHSTSTELFHNERFRDETCKVSNIVRNVTIRTIIIVFLGFSHKGKGR